MSLSRLFVLSILVCLPGAPAWGATTAPDSSKAGAEGRYLLRTSVISRNQSRLGVLLRQSIFERELELEILESSPEAGRLVEFRFGEVRGLESRPEGALRTGDSRQPGPELTPRDPGRAFQLQLRSMMGLVFRLRLHPDGSVTDIQVLDPGRGEGQAHTDSAAALARWSSPARQLALSLLPPVPAQASAGTEWKFGPLSLAWNVGALASAGGQGKVIEAPAGAAGYEVPLSLSPAERDPAEPELFYDFASSGWKLQDPRGGGTLRGEVSTRSGLPLSSTLELDVGTVMEGDPVKRPGQKSVWESTFIRSLREATQAGLPKGALEPLPWPESWLKAWKEDALRKAPLKLSDVILARMAGKVEADQDELREGADMMRSSDPDQIYELLVSGASDLSAEEMEQARASSAKEPKDLELRAILLGADYANSYTDKEAMNRKMAQIFWIVENVPDSPLAGSYAMMVFEDSERPGEYARLSKLWRKQMKSKARSAAVFRNAAAFYQYEDNSLAEFCYRKALALSPDQTPWWEELGELLSRGNNPKAAFEADMKGLGASSAYGGRQGLHSKAATEAYKAGLKEEAEREAGAALEDRDRNGRFLWQSGQALHDAHLVLGRLALDAGRWDDAAGELGKASDPGKDPIFLMNKPDMTLAQSLLAKGRKKEVESYLRGLLKDWTGGKKEIEGWIADLAAGGVPDFSARRDIRAEASTQDGKPAPAFSLKGLDGRTYSLSDSMGRVRVLDFWASWCVPCRRSMPGLQAVADRLKGEQVAFYLINQDPENLTAIKRVLKDLKISMTVLLDDKKTGEAYGTESIPRTFLVDGHGVIRRVHVGYSEDETKKLEQEIRTLLAGKPLESEPVITIQDEDLDSVREKLKQKPDDPELNLREIRFLEQAGRLEEVKKALTRFETLIKDDDKDRLWSAVDLWQNHGGYDRILGLIDRLQKGADKGPGPFEDKARALTGLGRSHEALDMLVTQARRHPEKDDLRLELAYLFQRQGRPKEGLKVLKDLKRDLGRGGRGLSQIAEAYLFFGEPELCFKTLNEAGGDDIWLPYTKGWRLLESGKIRDAEALFLSQAQSPGKFEGVRLNSYAALSWTSLLRGELSASRSWIQTARNELPGPGGSSPELAACDLRLARLGADPVALGSAQAQVLRMMDTKNWWGWQFLNHADLYIYLDLDAEAEDLALGASQCCAYHRGLSRQTLALIRARSGKYDEALDLAGSSLQDVPESLPYPRALASLIKAFVFQQKGDSAASAAAVAEAKALMPELGSEILRVWAPRK